MLKSAGPVSASPVRIGPVSPDRIPAAGRRNAPARLHIAGGGGDLWRGGREAVERATVRAGSAQVVLPGLLVEPGGPDRRRRRLRQRP